MSDSEMILWEAYRDVPFHDTWYTDIGYQGWSMYHRNHICTVRTTAPTSPSMTDNTIKHLSLIILNALLKGL